MTYIAKEEKPCPVCGKDAFIHRSNCIDLYFCIECPNCGVYQCLDDYESQSSNLTDTIEVEFDINNLKSYLFHNKVLNEKNKRLFILTHPKGPSNAALESMQKQYEEKNHIFNDVQLLTPLEVNVWYTQNPDKKRK